MRKTAFLLVLFTLPVMLAACSSVPVPAAPPVDQAATPSWVWDGTILSGKHTVVLQTTKGDITLELNGDIAPKTVTNFMALAASGYFNGLTFHRVIPGFMIQGGDPNGNGTGGRSIFGEMFEDEIKPDSAMYKAGYKEGVVAMANSGPNTNGSQFFIMDRDYPLPPKYTIFGSVAEGQEVVNAIANAERDPTNDMPKQKVTFVVKVIK
ncbi:MAG: peptidylprolyl isomerase [Candidatus Peribacteraceae bacterium]